MNESKAIKNTKKPIQNTEKMSIKCDFYHPSIEFAVERIMHSPYLTSPDMKYPGKITEKCYYLSNIND